MTLKRQKTVNVNRSGKELSGEPGSPQPPLSCLKSRSLSSKIPPPQERLCKKHGYPIVPSAWREGHRTTRCWKCKKYYDDGTPKPSWTHRRKSNRNRWKYRKSLNLRKYGLRGRLFGIRLWERSTGMIALMPGGTTW